VLAGADVCVEGSSVDAYGNPFDQVAFDAWKLGGNEIDLMQTFTGNAGLLLGSCFGTRDAETADSASRVSVRYDLSLKLL
jgi:hypothetical protein